MEILCLDIYIHIYYIIYTYSQSPPQKKTCCIEPLSGRMGLFASHLLYRQVSSGDDTQPYHQAPVRQQGRGQRLWSDDCPNWDGTSYISYITNTTNIDKPTNIKFQATNKLAWWNQSNQQWDDWKPVIMHSQNRPNMVVPLMERKVERVDWFKARDISVL